MTSLPFDEVGIEGRAVDALPGPSRQPLAACSPDNLIAAHATINGELDRRLDLAFDAIEEELRVNLPEGGQMTPALLDVEAARRASIVGVCEAHTEVAQ